MLVQTFVVGLVTRRNTSFYVPVLTINMDNQTNIKSLPKLVQKHLKHRNSEEKLSLCTDNASTSIKRPFTFKAREKEKGQNIHQALLCNMKPERKRKGKTYTKLYCVTWKDFLIQLWKVFLLSIMQGAILTVSGGSEAISLVK